MQLRRLGFRFIALADDNFYPVTLDDLAARERLAFFRTSRPIFATSVLAILVAVAAASFQSAQSDAQLARESTRAQAAEARAALARGGSLAYFIIMRSISWSRTISHNPSEQSNR